MLGVRTSDACIEERYESIGHEMPCADDATLVPNLTAVRAVEIGDGFARALRRDGTVWAWGRAARLHRWSGPDLPSSHSR